MTANLYDTIKDNIKPFWWSKVNLREEDLTIISNVQSSMQNFADLAGADIFIDVLTSVPNVALVIAEAKPTTAKSLYKGSVVGEPAYRVNEPAVFKTFETGKPSVNIRGVSQEGVPISQTVTPILNTYDEIVAVLIMERDISNVVKQEMAVELLSETTQKLTDALLKSAAKEDVLPTLLHDALLIVNSKGIISYANKVANELKNVFSDITLQGMSIFNLVKKIPELSSVFNKDSDAEEIKVRNCVLLVRSLPILEGEDKLGTVYLLRDITELRRKEKELMVKSAVIKEIHHRVKNNLQTIASLMRLQLRRINSNEAREAFKESINRIKCIALVHDFFSKESPEEIEMKACAEEISHIISEHLIDPTQRISIQVEGDRVFIPSEKATSVAIVVNELINNALEHAFINGKSGIIKIKFIDDKDLVKLEIQDNGIGLPKGFSVELCSNLGLQITQALVTENLNGQIKFLSNEGTLVKIQFPKSGDSSNDFLENSHCR
ncbi:MAG: two-component system, sensor histidine kinase PdtaS [Clostridia bacterium]|jgi:two-component sensor histidine kinase|nr:two-component system, sensor histidine kinase PdtaS [Clostridia bacterium]